MTPPLCLRGAGCLVAACFAELDFGAGLKRGSRYVTVSCATSSSPCLWTSRALVVVMSLLAGALTARALAAGGLETGGSIVATDGCFGARTFSGVSSGFLTALGTLTDFASIGAASTLSGGAADREIRAAAFPVRCTRRPRIRGSMMAPAKGRGGCQNHPAGRH